MRIFHSGKGQMLAFFRAGVSAWHHFREPDCKKYMTETGIFSDLFRPGLLQCRLISYPIFHIF